MSTLVYGASIKGNGHYINGVSCQDSNSYSESDLEENDIHIVALADGHGGAPYFRSGIGAKLATTIAKEELLNFISKYREILNDNGNINNNHPDSVTKTEEKNDGEKIYTAESEKIIENNKVLIDKAFSEVKKNILKKWREAVDKDLSKSPFSIAKITISSINSIDYKSLDESFYGYANYKKNSVSMVNKGLSQNDCEAISKNPRQLYGCTLLCVAQYNDDVFILQIGDGDIVIVDNEGKINHPVEKADELICNETNSMCQNRADQKFVEKHIKQKSKIIMLSSDGVINALEEEKELDDVAAGLYDSLIEDPVDFKNDFKTFLRNFSKGSMDDCTICLIANDIPDDVRETFKKSEELKEEVDYSYLFCPMFSEYKINKELYQITDSDKVDFSFVGRKSIESCFMKQKYLEFIECYDEFKQFISKYNSVSFFRGLEKYNSDFIENYKNDLNEEQLNIYKKKINSTMHESPVNLIKYAYLDYSYNSDTKEIIISQINEKYGVITSINTDTINYVDITKEVYEDLLNSIVIKITFTGKLPVNDNVYLNINKFNLKLERKI